MRTTSSLESLNSVIQRGFPKNTHIFKFTDALKLFESEKSSDLYQLSLEKPSDRDFGRRRKKDILRNEKIKRNTELLENDMISVLDFLQNMVKDGIYDMVYSLQTFSY